MNRLVLAFRSFFALLFSGKLPPEIAAELGLSAKPAPVPPPPPAPVVRTADGALQMLSILQRDGRLLDFLLEDIAPYTDEQVGAAVRDVQGQCREALQRYARIEPVIDGVEGGYVQAPKGKPELVKFVGNVPAQTPAGGILRHRGWRAAGLTLPAVAGKQDLTVLAPAEIEVE